MGWLQTMPNPNLGSPGNLSLAVVPDSGAVSHVSSFTMYMTYYDPFDVYIATRIAAPHHPPPKNPPYSKNGRG